MVVGMTVMRKANVVIRDLSALEALGGVTNICSDKTGTLTQGAMIVKKVWLPKVGILTVQNSMDPNNPTEGTVTIGPEPCFDETQNSDPVDYDRKRSTACLTFDIPADKVARDQEKNKKVQENEKAVLSPELESFLNPTALCNLATVAQEKAEGSEKKWQTTGEPTEIALQVFANRFDHGKKRLENQGWKQISEFPFDSSIKRMSVIYKSPNSSNNMIFTKGAVERVLDLCSSIGTGEHNQPMSKDLKEHTIMQMNQLAGQGQRVLAIASRTWNGSFSDHKRDAASKRITDDELRTEVEQNLTLIGLVGIYDPPRDETKGAIRECSEAGIKVHMLTASLCFFPSTFRHH